MDPVFDDSVPADIYPATAKSFVIDVNCPDFRPLTNNLEWYQQQGRITQDLTLCSVSEQDMQLIFYLFPNLSYLTLNNVFVVDSESMILLPTKLITLNLFNCRLNEKFTTAWFTALNNNKTIQGITINQCASKCPGSGYSLTESAKLLIDSARYIRLLDPGHEKCDLPVGDSSSAQLEQVTKRCPKTGNIVYLKYMSNDAKAPSDSIFYQKNHMKTITTVVLRTLPEDLTTLWQLKKLQHLRITNCVPADVKRRLRTLHLKTLDVWSYETDRPNKILTVLDDYSLLKIMSHLERDDVLALRSLHPRLEGLVSRHLQNMKEFKLDDHFVKKYPLNRAGIGLYDYIGKHVRSLFLSATEGLEILPHFRNLEKLYFTHRSPGSATLRLIPDGLKELDVYVYHEGVSFKELFRRLNKTLTTLCMSGPFNEDDLKELHHIKSLELGGLASADINLTPFLEQNADNLEYLELRLDDLEMETGHTKKFANLPPLKSLKKLILSGLDCTMKGFTLKPEDYPSLVEIQLSIDTVERRTQLQPLYDDLMRFSPNLKVLHLDGLKEFKQLYVLKNLEQFSYHDLNVEEEEILGLFRNLPNLKRIGNETDEEMSLHFELELRKILKEQNRKVTLYNVSWPTEYINFG